MVGPYLSRKVLATLKTTKGQLLKVTALMNNTENRWYQVLIIYVTFNLRYLTFKLYSLKTHRTITNPICHRRRVVTTHDLKLKPIMIIKLHHN